MDRLDVAFLAAAGSAAHRFRVDLKPERVDVRSDDERAGTVLEHVFGPANLTLVGPAEAAAGGPWRLSRVIDMAKRCKRLPMKRRTCRPRDWLTTGAAILLPNRSAARRNGRWFAMFSRSMG